jgi:hypothetical protein
MFELKLSDVPENKSTAGYLTDLGIFGKEINKNSLENYNFYEYTLEELGLPNHTEILNAVNSIKDEIGITPWKTSEGESNTYKGFSLTYNPDYIDSDVSIYHQTFGSVRLSQSFAFKNGRGNHQNIKNTYYDSYGFRKLSPVIDRHLGFLLNKFSCPLIRSRVAYLNMFEKTPTDSGWHIDESPNHLFRINIPIQTSEEYILDIEGTDEYGNSLSLRDKHLEVGKAYIWNTRIPHRVSINKPCQNTNDRIHLVLGLSPWFDYNSENDSFVSSKTFGMPLAKIITEKLFLR